MTISVVEKTTSTNQNTSFSPALKLPRRVLMPREVADDVDEPADVLDADAVVADEADEQPRHADDQDRPDEVVQRSSRAIASHENSV